MAAPGEQIYSTMPTYGVTLNARGYSANYDSMGGTSMAAPHVAGEAALLAAQSPQLSNADLRRLIVTHVDPYTPYYGPIAAGSGRINVYKALRAAFQGLQGLTLNPSAVPGGLGALVNGRVTLNQVATAPVTITLQSSAPRVASVPATVTVPAGASLVEFPITTSRVPGPQTVTLTASYNGLSIPAALTVLQILDRVQAAPWPGERCFLPVRCRAPCLSGCSAAT